MKHLKTLPLLLVILLTTFANINAQIKFPNDRHFEYQHDSLLMTTGILHPDFGKVDFEMRYWLRSSLHTFAHELFVMQLLKDKSWHLTHYQICLNEEQKRYEIVSRKDSLLNNWDNQWSKLLTCHVLTLADQRTWQDTDGGLVIIADGDYHILELITKKAKRSYIYSNPESYLKVLGPGREKLTDINEIIALLHHGFNFNYSKRCRCGQ